MSRSKKGIIVVIVMILLLLTYSKLAYVESSSIAGFPIPRGAEFSEGERDSESAYENYKWEFASEENGLPFLYGMTIRLWGWKKTERFGAQEIYVKDKREVSTISLTNELTINEWFEK